MSKVIKFTATARLYGIHHEKFNSQYFEQNFHKKPMVLRLLGR